MLPPAFDLLIQNLSKMPGIGKKTARRLAFYLLDNLDTAHHLSQSLAELNQIKHCQKCGFFTQQEEFCLVCSNPRRKTSTLCIVSKPQDMMAIEASNSFRGIYHILFGNISPLDGITPQDIRLAELEKRIQIEEIDELILALDSTVDGETTSQYIYELFKDKLEITRIAAGIPFGGELEYTDKITITRALSRRTSLDN